MCISSSLSPQGGKFEYQEDWGETYEKKANPSLFVCSLESEKVFPVEGIPEDLSVGQVQWHPSGKLLVFVGWKVDKRRLGIIHCFNRPSGIYSIPFNSEEIEAKLKTQENQKEGKNGTDVKEVVDNTSKCFSEGL